MTYTPPASIDEAIQLLVAGYSECNSHEERVDHLDLMGKRRVTFSHSRYVFSDSPQHSNLLVSFIVEAEPFMELLASSLVLPTTQIPDGYAHGVSKEMPSCNCWASAYYTPPNEYHRRKDYLGSVIIHLDWVRHAGAFPLTFVPSLDAPWPTRGFIEGRDFVKARGRLTLPALRKALRLGRSKTDPPHTYHHFVTEAPDKVTFEYRYHLKDNAICEEQRESQSITIPRSDYDLMLCTALEGGRCDKLCKAHLSHTTHVVRGTYGGEEPKTTEKDCTAGIMISVNGSEPFFAANDLDAQKVLQ